MNKSEELKLYRMLKSLPPNQINILLNELVSDPMLKDLENVNVDKLTPYEIEKTIALEQGKSILIYLLKVTGERLCTSR